MLDASDGPGLGPDARAIGAPAGLEYDRETIEDPLRGETTTPLGLWAKRPPRFHATNS